MGVVFRRSFGGWEIPSLDLQEAKQNIFLPVLSFFINVQNQSMRFPFSFFLTHILKQENNELWTLKCPSHLCFYLASVNKVVKSLIMSWRLISDTPTQSWTIRYLTMSSQTQKYLIVITRSSGISSPDELSVGHPVSGCTWFTLITITISISLYMASKSSNAKR